MAEKKHLPFHVTIFTFPGAPLSDALAVKEAFEEELRERGLLDLGPLPVALSGWRGIEGRDVWVEVSLGREVSVYPLVTPDMVPRIVRSHLDEGNPIREWQAEADVTGFHRPQRRRLSLGSGMADPVALEESLVLGGYSGLRKWAERGFEGFLALVAESGARDYGAVDAPAVGPLWEGARLGGERPTLIASAAPVTQHATGETLLCEGVPHQVIEGALCAAGALGAQAVVFYIPAAHGLAAERMRAALEVLRASDVLPEAFRQMHLAIVSGESRILPGDGVLPPEATCGGPVCVHSVEMLAALPALAREDSARWFRNMGTDSAPGTRLWRLVGAIERPGFVEVPLGAPLSRVVEEAGGGLRRGRRAKGIRVGGPLGALFPRDALDTPLAPETLAGLGASFAVPVIEVLDERECVVSRAREGLRLAALQPGAAGRITRLGFRSVLSALSLLIDGKSGEDSPRDLTASAEMLARSPSRLATAAAGTLLSALRVFREEFRLHAENRHCPARVCPRLLPAPCHDACPSHIDIPSYLACLAAGRPVEAAAVIREDNPFPWVCGLICPAPCETACVRRHIDEPISIKSLKAFVAERAEAEGRYPVPAPPPDACRGRVAIVGAGPAGLSCAHFLALSGYAVTVFEALPKPGGLFVYGIPEYRLPREVVAREIHALEGLGIEIRCGVALGRDVTLEELRAEGYKAFFLGIGAHRGFHLGIEGEGDFPQVYDAIRFLREVNLGRREPPAETVAVVGGGNSAIDAARTCVRLGCRDVHVVYRRTRDEMLAHPDEVEQAFEEGVRIHFLAVPVKVGGEGGRVTHLECLRAELGRPDASGRRRPVPIPGSTYRIWAGAIVTAIGQQPDLSWLREQPPFKVTAKNLIVTRHLSTQTSIPDIFAGGDVVTGPATVVEAIGAGKQAARDIHHYLSGAPGEAPLGYPRRRRMEPFQVIEAAEKVPGKRIRMPLLPAAVRVGGFSPVELGHNEGDARREARRCLRCDVCIRCGACERTCRDDMHVQALAFRQIGPGERMLADYPRAGERCIACGACALVCPTGAIQFIETKEHREVRLCGTVLNRLELPRCKSCGEPFVPARYLEYVTKRSDFVMRKQVLRRLCPACARRVRAEPLGGMSVTEHP